MHFDLEVVLQDQLEIRNPTMKKTWINDKPYTIVVTEGHGDAEV